MFVIVKKKLLQEGQSERKKRVRYLYRTKLRDILLSSVYF